MNYLTQFVEDIIYFFTPEVECVVCQTLYTPRCNLFPNNNLVPINTCSPTCFAQYVERYFDELNENFRITRINSNLSNDNGVAQQKKY